MNMDDGALWTTVVFNWILACIRSLGLMENSDIVMYVVLSFE
jgi:hypothetical protein